MNWKLVVLAFGMLFLAELGDKTQLAVFTLVAQHKQPWPIFIGASAALILVTFLGACFGSFVTKHIPTSILRLAVGILFIGIGIFVLKEALPEVWRVYFSSRN
jgi:putative Ca2+/H+ antiporter (TMEM165/GDT1 family)